MAAGRPTGKRLRRPQQSRWMSTPVHGTLGHDSGRFVVVSFEQQPRGTLAMGGILKFFGSVVGIIFLIGLIVVVGLLMLIF